MKNNYIKTTNEKEKIIRKQNHKEMKISRGKGRKNKKEIQNMCSISFDTTMKKNEW